jgi:hypothetical protein
MKLTIAIPQSRDMVPPAITTVATTIATAIALCLHLVMFANRDQHPDFLGHSKPRPVPAPMLTTTTTNPLLRPMRRLTNSPSRIPQSISPIALIQRENLCQSLGMIPSLIPFSLF